MVKAFLRHYLPPYDPHAGGRELKVILQLYLLPYAIRLACRLLPRSPHAGGHAEVEAQTTHACLPPKVTIAGGHAKVKANLLPGCQPARSCSKPYALRLPNATEVPLAGGRVEVKAACSQSTSQRSRCTPQQSTNPRSSLCRRPCPALDPPTACDSTRPFCKGGDEGHPASLLRADRLTPHLPGTRWSRPSCSARNYPTPHLPGAR